MNNNYKKIARVLIGATIIALQPALVYAQDAPAADQVEPAAKPSVFSSSATVSLITDYRFRGISLNNGRQAVQGSITVKHESGLYVTAWGSPFSAIEGDSSEIAVYGGYQRKIGGVGFDVGAVGYLFPGDDDINFFELYGSASKSFGPLSSSVGIYYAPKQDSGSVRRVSGRTGDSVYVYGSGALAIPKTPVTLSAQIGYERGARILSEGGKVDWDLGISVRAIGLNWAVHYIDSDAPTVRSFTGNNITRGAAVASISKSF